MLEGNILQTIEQVRKRGYESLEIGALQNVKLAGLHCYHARYSVLYVHYEGDLPEVTSVLQVADLCISLKKSENSKEDDEALVIRSSVR